MPLAKIVSAPLLLLGIAPALAQTAPPPPVDNHAPASPDIIVTGALSRDRHDALSGASVLQGTELTRALRPTIGETLARTPGVSATSFGPNASRPVLRGLQGERIRVLTDGIGSIDVSNTSVDHAVVVDPLLAERIEVLRGPEALLYGSSAVGGVVNVIDRRIPRVVPQEAVHVGAIATYGSAANERSVAGSVDAPVTSTLVIHADGSRVQTGYLRIGGHVLSPSARADALAAVGGPADPDAGDPIDFAANAALKGKLPNSQSKTWTAGAGAALITSGGNIGVSYSHYDSLYGVPVRYATGPDQEQEAPRLDIVQNRVDFRGEIDNGGPVIAAIRTRVGIAQYRHFELEEDGAIGTAFYNKGMEGRLEVVQANGGGWKGVTGGQVFTRDFNVVGDEAFLPRNTTEQYGLFTLQQYDVGALKLSAGGRYERQTVSGQPLPDQPQFSDDRRTFNSLSGSGGASYGISDQWRVGVNLSRTERAPSAEELLANGPHAGTEAFEIGDPDLKKEKSLGAELLLDGRGEGYHVAASAYYTDYANFIYEDRTGDLEDGLPVYRNRQADARYYGFEAEGQVTLARIGAAAIQADGVADYVHARIDGVGPAPRIPPLRLLGGLGVTTPKVDVRGEVEHAFAQNRLAPLETRTAAFTLVNAEATIRPWGNDRPLSFVLSANNIFDVDARRSASFLKDFAPLAGRDVRVTARASF